MKTSDLENHLPPQSEMERAFAAKDAGYDGLFYAAVRTTGIFCRPSCPSRPKRENVEFFASIRECFAAGYRPCLRCRPLQADGTPPGWVAGLIKRIEASPGVRLKGDDLRALGVTPERARRWFMHNYGMSFAAWSRGYCMAAAFAQIRDGAALDDAVFGSGFESHSGFRDAFARTFGDAPGRSRKEGGRIVATVLETPIGAMLAATTDDGVCFLDYTDGRMLERNVADIRRHFGWAIVPGKHRLLTKLSSELAEYFAGKKAPFTVPMVLAGTAFQKKVWAELRRIPYGETISYAGLARRIGQPAAVRAVARANAMNPICILIPCHRVISKDGTLSGYSGGVWRKRLLLNLEEKGRL